MGKSLSFLGKIAVNFVWYLRRSFINLLIGKFLKFKTYILTIRYNVDKDRPEFIREELIVEDDEVFTLKVDNIDEISIEDFDDLEDIALA
jgi:hypothetical protein